VTSTLQWTPQLKPRDVHDVRVFLVRVIRTTPALSGPSAVFELPRLPRSGGGGGGGLDAGVAFVRDVANKTLHRSAYRPLA
jgi:hypothetical protein